MLKIDENMMSLTKPGFVAEFLDCATRTLTLANCTPVSTGVVALGSKRADGSYSGALGEMVGGVSYYFTMSLDLFLQSLYSASTQQSFRTLLGSMPTRRSILGH